MPGAGGHPVKVRKRTLRKRDLQIVCFQGLGCGDQCAAFCSRVLGFRLRLAGTSFSVGKLISSSKALIGLYCRGFFIYLFVLFISNELSLQ